jgi:uncharacterized protein (TIGR03067 family)
MRAHAPIDPSRTPRAIDATPSSGPNRGETWLGIYEVMGDLYKIAFAPPGKTHPTRVDFIDFWSK